jgi:hypothetical protein
MSAVNGLLRTMGEARQLFCRDAKTRRINHGTTNPRAISSKPLASMNVYESTYSGFGTISRNSPIARYRFHKKTNCFQRTIPDRQLAQHATNPPLVFTSGLTT